MGKFVPNTDLSSLSSSSGGFERKPTLLDAIQEEKRDINLRKLQKGVPISVRLIGGYLPTRMHWVKSLKGNTMPPFYCSRFNPNTKSFNNPYDVLDDSGKKIGEEPADEYRCIWCYLGERSSKNYFINVIDRNFQKNNPDDNPIKLLSMNSGIIKGLEKIIANEGISPNDIEQGYDTVISKTVGENNINQYDMGTTMRSRQEPLSKRERKYELIDLSALYDSIMLPIEENLIQAFRCRRISYDDAMKILKHYRSIHAITPDVYGSVSASFGNIARKQEEYDNKNGEGDEDEKPSKKYTRGADLDDDEEEEEKSNKAFKAAEKYSKFEDDDDDEDDRPRKKKKVDDDDDEDERPSKKSSSRFKRRDEDDDDDEDERPIKKKRVIDEDDDDEDEDERPRKKKRPVDDDEDDD